MSQVKFNTSVSYLALICFAFLGAYACNSVQFIPGAGGNSGSFVYNGVTYSSSLDDAGNLVVTTSDGSTFKLDANGNLIETTSPDGATIAIVNQGGNNPDVTSFFPELENSARPKTLRMTGEYTAQSVRVICDQITQTCSFADENIRLLRRYQDRMVDRYKERLGESFSRDYIAAVVEVHIERIAERLTNFCAGWNLATLLNKNPCDPDAGQPCDSLEGEGWIVSENNTSYDSVFRIQIDGTNAIAELDRVRNGTTSSSGQPIEILLRMDGTLSKGSGGCAGCTVFRGTWSGEFGDIFDLVPGTPPPVRTFVIVFAEDHRSFTGTAFENSQTRYLLDGLRPSCR
jgi:YD repeat-containing protein